jgi:hypothetical protein
MRFSGSYDDGTVEKNGSESILQPNLPTGIYKKVHCVGTSSHHREVVLRS